MSHEEEVGTTSRQKHVQGKKRRRCTILPGPSLNLTPECKTQPPARTVWTYAPVSLPPPQPAFQDPLRMLETLIPGFGAEQSQLTTDDARCLLADPGMLQLAIRKGEREEEARLARDLAGFPRQPLRGFRFPPSYIS